MRLPRALAARPSISQESGDPVAAPFPSPRSQGPTGSMYSGSVVGGGIDHRSGQPYPRY